MGGSSRTAAEEMRLEMYRQAAVEARAEIEEIEAHVLTLQARVDSLMSRARSLEGLVGTVRDLVGPSVERPEPFRPVRIEAPSSFDVSLPRRRRDRVTAPEATAAG